jgi:hypothetical protein
VITKQLSDHLAILHEYDHWCQAHHYTTVQSPLLYMMDLALFSCVTYRTQVKYRESLAPGVMLTLNCAEPSTCWIWHYFFLLPIRPRWSTESPWLLRSGQADPQPCRAIYVLDLALFSCVTYRAQVKYRESLAPGVRLTLSWGRMTHFY